MIDFDSIYKYKENNRIEAKKSLGGLPHSIWETYSSFANTLGGVILLGVVEKDDKYFDTVNLPAPEVLIEQFWEIINDPKKVSVNILSESDVYIQTVNGDRIVVINVPKAERAFCPIFLDQSPVNAYRRNGEGDYKCTPDELEAMKRDALLETSDMKLLDNMDISVINMGTLNDYRDRMYISRPGHVWEDLSDEEFLVKIGAAGLDADGKLHPTAAGLLMFANEYDIVKEFPDFALDYRRYGDDGESERLVSCSGTWSGNLFDFFQRAEKRIKSLTEDFGTEVTEACEEALKNSLVHADYYGKKGVVIIHKEDALFFSNPGDFRISTENAKMGGVSDPRNSMVLNMLNFVELRKHPGNGIPNIVRVWKEKGWKEPVIVESFNPERITMALSLKEDEEGRGKSTVKRVSENNDWITRAFIIDFLTLNRASTLEDISREMGIDEEKTLKYLESLLDTGYVIETVENDISKYDLRS